MVLLKALQPVTDRVRRNLERRRFDLAGPANSAARPRPGKECENRSRRAAVVAEIKMITSRIVEIDCALDETQPEKADIEIKIVLGIAGDRRHVMEAAKFVFRLV